MNPGLRLRGDTARDRRTPACRGVTSGVMNMSHSDIYCFAYITSYLISITKQGSARVWADRSAVSILPLSGKAPDGTQSRQRYPVRRFP